VYAVDNDEVGLKFNQDKIENNLVHREHGEMSIYFAVPPKRENVKDWNDELVRRNVHAYQEHEKNIPLSKKQYLQNYRHRGSDRELEIDQYCTYNNKKVLLKNNQLSRSWTLSPTFRS